jgi:ATP-binding cassette subfamily B protein
MAKPPQKKGVSIFGLLKSYLGLVVTLLLLAVGANALNLIIPRITASGIDAFTAGTFVFSSFAALFLGVIGTIFVVAYLQSIMQTYVSERVARDLRAKLAAKISSQTYSYVQGVTPSKLLTNLTSDIDGVKMFVSMAIVTLVSSVFMILGASAMLLSIDWKLGLAVLSILPLIAGSFAFIFSKVGVLFKAAQGVIDTLNKVINESILGSALIRVLNSEQREYTKFLAANTEAKDVGMKILAMFASLIPIVTFLANMAGLIILALGGRYVINGEMSLGDFMAFNSYMAVLIFPIFMIGFMSSMIGRAQASYERIAEVLDTSVAEEGGTVTTDLKGDIELRDVSLSFGEKPVLKHVSITAKAGTKTAILGPTAAGKTQLLQLLTGLSAPTTGTVLYDNRPVAEYDKAALHRQLGFVFQDSIVFNMSLRENIAFSGNVSEADMNKAIETAELSDFLATLPEGIESVVSERGTSLSGGQKQRLMLARALALNPKILLLDDFTARVDNQTEHRILSNVAKNYPGLTLMSITQKIASVEDYDQIILLMEGEVLARGTHKELLETSPEYVQIFNSQQSTERL